MISLRITLQLNLRPFVYVLQVSRSIALTEVNIDENHSANTQGWFISAMKFLLFCVTIVLIADVCRAGPLAAVDISIRSEGCNDPDKTADTCGIAYIKVDGVEQSPKGRGHNVVVVDLTTGKVLDKRSFDTHGDAAAGNNLRDHLNSIIGHKAVLVAIQDEGSIYVAPAFDALKRLGATAPILTDVRGSFAFIGYAGVAKPSWITQDQQNSAEGPSEVSAKIPLSPSPPLDISIRSEGCNDPDKTAGTCGLAYIYVDGADQSLHGRGHNVVVVDIATGTVLDKRSFDTHGDAAAGNNLRDFLSSITGHKAVLVAIQDEGSKYVSPAFDALKRLGATAPILTDVRGSFALVGYAGVTKPSWITQDQQNSEKGPSEVSAKIPVLPSPSKTVAIHIRSEGCNDPAKTPNTCGLAYIYVNDVDRSLHARGHNVVVLDAATGAFLEAKGFDTHGDAAAGNSLRDYLNSITGNKIVLVAIQDEGSEYVAPAIDALKRLGATAPILTDSRGSFAFVGYARDTKPSWITQDQQNSAKGPSLVTVQILLPSTPSEYRKDIGQGFATNWFKTADPLSKYNDKNIEDIFSKNFRNVRLRSRADLYPAPYNTKKFDEFLDSLTKVVDKCLEVGVAPIISWINHHAEAYATDEDRQNYVAWWTAVAKHLKNKDYRLSFNLFTELGKYGCGEKKKICNGSLRMNPDKYNRWTSDVVAAIRATGGKNSNRILILGSPGKTAEDLDKIDPAIYQNDLYMMAEWHLYASGPNKDIGGQKYWKGDGTPDDKNGRDNVRKAIKQATDFTNKRNLLTYLGAWMPADNDSGGLKESEVINFARFFASELRKKKIPWSLNVLDRYYDTEKKKWLTGKQDIKGRLINMSEVLKNIQDEM
ncbi:uncharacterized protein LOC144654856 isoform X2 [Oculina patagonica]